MSLSDSEEFRQRQWRNRSFFFVTYFVLTVYLTFRSGLLAIIDSSPCDLVHYLTDDYAPSRTEGERPIVACQPLTPVRFSGEIKDSIGDEILNH
jgi:hypothetical protein